MSTVSFIAEFDELTRPNPFNSREGVWDNAVAFEVSIFDGCVRLSNIRALRPGVGTLGLEWLCALADKHDAVVTGTAKPTGTNPRLNKTALKAWYRRHGFTVSARGDVRYTPAGRR